MKKPYIQLKDLETYKLARDLSGIGWKIYKDLDWRARKIIGDQFITATDSVGANIAEGYARYHYLDKIRFLYNSRGSLMEALEHWLELLKERQLLKEGNYQVYTETGNKESLKLQNFISSIYKSKRDLEQ